MVETVLLSSEANGSTWGAGVCGALKNEKVCTSANGELFVYEKLAESILNSLATSRLRFRCGQQTYLFDWGK